LDFHLSPTILLLDNITLYLNAFIINYIKDAKMLECTYTSQVRKNGTILKKLTYMWRFLLHTYESSINILNYSKAEYGGNEDGCSPDGSAGYISAPQLRL
jgi:hypothetical protein